MKKQKWISLLLVLVLVCNVLITGCDSNRSKDEVGPEVGKWHGEVKLSDLSGNSMSEEDKSMLALLAGNIFFDIDVEFCKDGTFSYEVNTDKLEEAFSKSVSTFSKWILNFDISLFVDRIVESALSEVMENSNTDMTGEYYTREDGVIVATDNGTIYFKIMANRLIQIDENGNKFIDFKKAESSK